jgi:hypothetical protein
MKLAVVAPLRTVTVDGKVTEDEVELIVTTLPPVAALVESVTVPVELPPPSTAVGESVSFVTLWA